MEEIFEGDFAEMCAEKFPLMSMRGREEGLACADPVSRTPIGLSGNFILYKASQRTINMLQEHVPGTAYST